MNLWIFYFSKIVFILFCIFFVLVLACIIFIIVSRKRKSNTTPPQSIELIENLQNTITNLQKQNEELKNNYTVLAAKYHEYEQYKDKKRNLQDELIDEVKKNASQKAEAFEKSEAYWNQRQQKVLEEFQAFKTDIDTQIQYLQKFYEQAQQKQNEIIMMWRREEEKKTERNKYHIIIKEDDLQDIKKFKQFSSELKNPRPLMQYVYKEYYEKPFKQMANRVVGQEDKIGIYKITNELNQKCYIGQTKQGFKKRWAIHVRTGLKASNNNSSAIHEAMWTDGLENFSFEILSVCEKESLNQKEKEYITFYKSNEWGYNLTKGNEG